jgi:hypothetical protein
MAQSLLLVNNRKNIRVEHRDLDGNFAKLIFERAAEW